MRFLTALAAGLGLALIWALSAALAAPEPAAADLAQRLGCFACHGGGPGHRAQSLAGVGARLSWEKLAVVLKQPRQLYPGAKMPSYAYLPAAERQALVDFLSNFK